MKRLFFIPILTFYILGCSESHHDRSISGPITPGDSVVIARWKEISSIKDSIREGDLIVRRGNDNVSESLSDFSQQEKLFSHSGIALQGDGIMYVYNNMAGDLNPDEIMRRDPLDSFIVPTRNIAIGVYRYDLKHEELQRVKAIVINHYHNGLQFDMNFDLATDDKMYCAEMIAKTIENATDKRIRFLTSTITPGLKEKYLKLMLEKRIISSAKVADQREYLAIDNLYLNPHCSEVTKVVFGERSEPIKFPAPENDKQ